MRVLQHPPPCLPSILAAGTAQAAGEYACSACCWPTLLCLVQKAFAGTPAAGWLSLAAAAAARAADGRAGVRVPHLPPYTPDPYMLWVRWLATCTSAVAVMLASNCQGSRPRPPVKQVGCATRASWTLCSPCCCCGSAWPPLVPAGLLLLLTGPWLRSTSCRLDPSQAGRLSCGGQEGGGVNVQRCRRGVRRGHMYGWCA